MVSRLHDHEARRLEIQWNLPDLLARPSGTHPRRVVLCGKNLGAKGVASSAIRTMDELPNAEYILGIDCEFVKINMTLLDFDSDRVDIKKIGCASCVNATGEKIIFDDHVLLVTGFEVIAYLTKYSGIVEDHLNPAASDKFLTTHKSLLLRKHVLMQRGVNFVGHALHNDFTVLYFHVPEPRAVFLLFV